jgi:hypothetical protein
VGAKAAPPPPPPKAAPPTDPALRDYCRALLDARAERPELEEWDKAWFSINDNRFF